MWWRSNECGCLSSTFTDGKRGIAELVYDTGPSGMESGFEALLPWIGTLGDELRCREDVGRFGPADDLGPSVFGSLEPDIGASMFSWTGSGALPGVE